MPPRKPPSARPDIPQSRALVPYPEAPVLRPQPADPPAHPRPGQEEPAFEGDLQLAWVQLRGNWTWLVMIPTDPRDSAAAIARSLCKIGARLSVFPVEFIEATNVDLDNSSMLITRLGTSAGAGWGPSDGSSGRPAFAPPIMKTIVALESPLANPLALPLALAADGVVLCVRKGRDRLASVRETVAAVGAERILCCLLVD